MPGERPEGHEPGRITGRTYQEIYASDEREFDNWRRWDYLFASRRADLEKYLALGGIPPAEVDQVMNIISSAGLNYARMLGVGARLSVGESLRTIRSGHGSKMKQLAGLEAEKDSTAAELDRKWNQWQPFTFARLKRGDTWEDAIKDTRRSQTDRSTPKGEGER